MPDGVVGSTLYSAVEIAERALRKIGSYSINDTAAQQEDLQEALYWFDMETAHLAGTGKCFWLMRDEVSITLAEDDPDYDLETETGQQLETGVQFTKEAVLDDGNGNRTPLRIVSQREFRRLTKPGTTGQPALLFIDRLNGPTMHVYPIPNDAVDGWTIVLTLQTFANSVKPRGLTGDSGIGNQNAGFPAAWNLWAVTMLASLIGDGPVRALPLEKIRSWKLDAAVLLRGLDAYQNREHDNDPPYSKASAYL